MVSLVPFGSGAGGQQAMSVGGVHVAPQRSVNITSSGGVVAPNINVHGHPQAYYGRFFFWSKYHTVSGVPRGEGMSVKHPPL